MCILVILSSKCLEKLVSSIKCTTEPCNLFSTDTLPSCTIPQDQHCLIQHIYHTQVLKNRDLQNCFKKKRIMTYKVQELILTDSYKKLVVNVKLASMKKEIMEDVELLTVSSLIGSLGGSLGMFFGFSFSGLFFYLLETFISKFQYSWTSI